MRARHLTLELRGGALSGRIVVLRFERAADRADGRHEARLLAERRLEEHLQIARGRPVHPGKLNHSAERDQPDAVFDAVAPDLEESRREADVEAPRPHADCARDREVPELVQEDEHDETRCGDEIRGHAAASAPSAISRAARSASTRSSTSLTASVPAAASVSSTTSGMPRNGSCPARNAATATSFAAL